LNIIDSSGIKPNKEYLFDATGQTSNARYNDWGGNPSCDYDWKFLTKGKIVISKLEKNVISGTFEFASYSPFCPDTVRISDRRFDIGGINIIY
jgi:hypothetical protein